MQCSNASKELRETRTWGLVSQKKKKKKKERKKNMGMRFHGFLSQKKKKDFMVFNVN